MTGETEREPDGHDPERLRRLDARLAALRARQAPPPRADEHFSQANVAWRMVIELVAGLGIGFGIGIGLDALLGTRPVFLVAFTFLGFAAGIRVMLRTAQEVQERQAAEAAGDEGAAGEAAKRDAHGG